ncbi:hypothetical protein LCGC14_1461000 [marine sediment metagenome]|uniref:Uncharacterized protein n=1 Tax=marine sediment metagenome TaxID=412755 RepID=A0A0F9LVR1_9ZZZZ
MKKDERANETSVTVRFTRGYMCFDEGQVKDVTPQFGYALIDSGVAKRVKSPKRDKQMSGAPMEKSL